jgi:hypothetical protein
VEFEVGSWVWVRLLQRTAVGVTAASHTKLGPKFYGPFQVVQRIGSVSYKLQLPANARIHDVFHVALLKKFEGTTPDKVVSLPPILHGRILPVPEKVVKARPWCLGSPGALAWLFCHRYIMGAAGGVQDSIPKSTAHG